MESFVDSEAETGRGGLQFELRTKTLPHVPKPSGKCGTVWGSPNVAEEQPTLLFNHKASAVDELKVSLAFQTFLYSGIIMLLLFLGLRENGPPFFCSLGSTGDAEKGLGKRVFKYQPFVAEGVWVAVVEEAFICWPTFSFGFVLVWKSPPVVFCLNCTPYNLRYTC